MMEKMTPCPKTPNCVSSVDTDSKHFIQPLQFVGKASEAHERLLKILYSLKRVRVVASGEDFIRAEFVSAIFRFVDDVEFYLDDRNKVIHVKSASRVGYSDLGVNRRRVENLRKRFGEVEGGIP
ncbi:MAG: DUF1499 domain-containing protein [Desulfobacterales bacterium]